MRWLKFTTDGNTSWGIVEGDKVVTRITAYGVHERDLPGIPATGRQVKMTGTAMSLLSSCSWKSRPSASFKRTSRMRHDASSVDWRNSSGEAKERTS